ncbi:MAG TPA: SDR family oxidoreductase [Pseudomonadales bacterium]|nr:SDR family oxidoreductase [Pseudomonadales bacterium]
MSSIPISFDLAGRRVAVVGGSSGIGLECVRLAAEAGAQVAAGGRSAERRTAAAASLGDAGASVSWHEVDVQAPETMAAMFAALAPLDLIVFAATGTTRAMGPFMDMDMAGFQRSFGKLWGYANGVQQGVPHLAAEGGIVLVGGVVARKCPPGMIAVSSVGNAVEGFCRALAVEIAPQRVNVVAPGTIDTAMHEALPAERREAMYAQAARTLPAGRVGRPEEVASAILAVGLNPYITGTTVDVDGGFLLP